VNRSCAALRAASLLAAALALGPALIPAACGGTASTDPTVPDDTTTPPWQQVAAFGGPGLSFSAAFTIGNRAYAGTGYDPTTAFWQYDPDGNTWTRKAEFGGAPRGAAIAFSIGERGYIGTGYGAGGNRFSDLWEYDPATDRWAQKASLPAAVRDHAAAFVIGQRAYVVGGMTCDGEDCSSLREVWEYEPLADSWTRKADLPVEMTTASCFVLNGLGYVGTGYAGPSGSSAPSTYLWAYDPLSDTWMARALLPAAARYRAVAFAMNGKGYLGTGIASVGATSDVVLNDMWEYDPSTNAWTQMPDFSGPERGAAVSFVLGARAYIGMGGGPLRQPLRDFWRTASPTGARTR